MSLIDQDKNRVSVTQDNQLIEASYTLTLNEKRLLLLGISKLDPRHFPPAGAEFELTVAEWKQHFPQDGTPWRALQRAAKQMIKRHVTFHPKTGITEDVNWFDSVRYVEAEGRISVRFTYSITTRLQGMMEAFTRLSLLDVSKLNSFHSIRLYELASQFRSTGYRKITVADFRGGMDCAETYPRMGDFKTRVLRPALKEINEKSDFKIECRDIKRGRKITAFEFIISEKEQGDLFK
ncbi:replication initiation protein [Zhongshania sp. BJYM1]|uniref:replication initiation protein n=1 Tax=Zhongshania aquatica TaxID=2965069 RepID=UPI0022B3413F|nr:replication initiation protein [Marortus sp. BJYM1]